jgi:hypothetical protein
VPVVTSAYRALINLHIVRAHEGTLLCSCNMACVSAIPLAALLFALTVQDPVKDVRDAALAATPLGCAYDNVIDMTCPRPCGPRSHST